LKEAIDRQHEQRAGLDGGGVCADNDVPKHAAEPESHLSSLGRILKSTTAESVAIGKKQLCSWLDWWQIRRYQPPDQNDCDSDGGGNFALGNNRVDAREKDQAGIAGSGGKLSPRTD